MSEHFSLPEFLHSDTALQHNIENHPSWDVVEALARLADVLEQIRALLGVPVQVTSGFRCTALNSAVGGVADSAHLFGCACDFVAPEYGDITDIIQAVQPAMVSLGIDQLIHEGDWVHLGLAVPPAEPRHQCFHV
jgi:zinc D-Ala-D-Ala carboxypeptidase